MINFIKNFLSEIISRSNDRNIFAIGSAHFSIMQQYYSNIKHLSDVNYKVLYKYLTNQVYELWREDHADLADNVEEETSTMTPKQSGGRGSRTTHTSKSAYEAYLQLKANEFSQEAKFTKKEYNLPQALISALGITWDENTNLKKSNMDQTRIVELSLQEKDVGLPLDKIKGRKKNN